MASTDKAADNETAQWREELALLGELSSINQEIAGYIVRALDADTGRVEPTSPLAEFALGTQMVRVGTLVASRAEQRRPGALVIEAESAESNPGQDET